ncbi:MAG: hypothetical protein AAGE61_18190 [Pseudomonadota bacterium]
MNSRTVTNLLKLRVERENKAARRLAEANSRLAVAKKRHASALLELGRAVEHRRRVAAQLYSDIRNRELTSYAFQARIARIANLDAPVVQARKAVRDAEEAITDLGKEIQTLKADHVGHARAKEKWLKLENDQISLALKKQANEQERETEESAIERYEINRRNSEVFATTQGAFR